MTLKKDYYYLVNNYFGEYVISENTLFEELLTKKPLKICDIKVNVGEYTTLDNCFRSLKYVGCLKNDALFYYGVGDTHIFNGGGHIYIVVNIVSEDTIKKMHVFENVVLKRVQDFTFLGNYKWQRQ